MQTVEFAFFEALRAYYVENRGKIRRSYKGLTKKYLDYNDKRINPNAFLREPQFEALEMYVFLKEFMQNEQMYVIFDDWYSKKNHFSDNSYYYTSGSQLSLYDVTGIDRKKIYTSMKKNSGKYPNYIFALTMGLGKTILMATCIFYEFLLANKYPKDKRFCHNVLVFAPDKTVLHSLKEIQTFDKSLVIPHEYARVLDSNIKFHFLEDVKTSLNTIDNSDFNIIISNTQKIILKEQRTEPNAAEKLFSLSKIINDSPLGDIINDLYEISSEKELLSNQRFEKLTRLEQLGIYVDEAHHMFGKDLNKSVTSLRTTIDALADSLSSKGTHVVACYSYTGTPYVNNSILPEVVYSYGLGDAISKRYLKSLTIKGYENVKNEEFLRDVIKDFWGKYHNQLYEGLLPKLAIFGATVEEVTDEIQPIVEKILAEMNIPTSKILVNVGDEKVTKDEDVRNFNNLDKIGTEGANKQFILLVNKGREGWNCRSLFGVALFRKPKSTVFVLQATMRCLRKITNIQQTASVYLSKENMDILDSELQQNFRINIKDINAKAKENKITVQVRPTKPPKVINLKIINHRYYIKERNISEKIDFGLNDYDYEKYNIVVYEKNNINIPTSIKEKVKNEIREQIIYSNLTLVTEISRYLNIKCVLVNKILKDSVDGISLILEMVNKYNELIYDLIIPTIFNFLYEVNYVTESRDKEVLLLKEPKNADYYSYQVKPDLVISEDDYSLSSYKHKSFHADNYCFDSKPEKELFLQYIMSDQVKEVYFTGMFTNDQNGLYIHYIDPEDNTLRKYYPDFIAQMSDGSYQIIEVKGDNKIDDEVVKAKSRAAEEIAMESKMSYKMVASSVVSKTNIL